MTNLPSADPLGNTGRAKMGAQALIELAQRKQNHRYMQIVNRARDADPVPGLQVVMSYAQRLEQLEDAMRDLIAEHADISDEFEAEVLALRQAL